MTLLARDAPGHRLLVLDALRPYRVQIQLREHLMGSGFACLLAQMATREPVRPPYRNT